MKDSPKQRSEIIQKFGGNKTKTTTDRLLRNLERAHLIFRVEVDKSVFFKRNIFSRKILMFFSLCDELKYPDLLNVKDEVLLLYPDEQFEQILKKNIASLSLAKPENKGIIQLLKDFEGDMYE